MVVRLNIEMEVVCSEEFIKRIEDDGVGVVLSNCFKNNTRTVVNVSSKRLKA